MSARLQRPGDSAAPSTALVGCILGTAVGDAMGLPFEGLARNRVGKWFKNTHRHHFLLRRGMVSDDTEHICMAAQALIESGGEVEAFRQCLAQRLRFWLLGLPAGAGLATLRACLKLWLGFSPSRSGVWSAGNGPAIRSPIIGVAWGHDIERLGQLVQVSTRLTHTDPKAEHGAFAVALAAHLAASGAKVTPEEFEKLLSDVLAPVATEEFLSLMARALHSAAAREPTSLFATSLGLERGVSGYVYHTVPVAIHAWLRHQHDYREAVIEVIRCGGDTDSTAAIVGALVGAGAGLEGIPGEWRTGLLEWPRTDAWMQALGEQLAAARAGHPASAPGLSPLAIGLRNFFFLMVVLAHGFRRLLPPY